VDLTATLDAPCAPGELFAWVEDLDRYPAWLSIVPRAVRTAPDTWEVELRGRIGPFARSKRLRMVRTQLEPGRLAVFERQEADDRVHAPWVLRAEVTGEGGESHLAMHLHYGGSLWGPVLERLLADEVERSRPRLLGLLNR
jgi:hypothetical protein